MQKELKDGQLLFIQRTTKHKYSDYLMAQQPNATAMV
jgi:hypothetical protein